MVRPGRECLNGAVEIDETYWGAEEGVRGRQALNKLLIVVAVEQVGSHGLGRVRMCRVPDASADSLQAFVEESVEPGTAVTTDGWLGYDRLKARGYDHRIIFLKERRESAVDLLPRVHRVVSLLKRWLLGTHQGSVSIDHLDYYLDEFTFRFKPSYVPASRETLLPIGTAIRCSRTGAVQTSDRWEPQHVVAT